MARKRTIRSDSKMKAQASEPPVVRPLLSSVIRQRSGPWKRPRGSDHPHNDMTVASQKENTIAAASVDASTDNEDPDVEIKREMSAWDAIGERFENAAHDGRYIDLTDGKERSLPPTRAAAEFAVTKIPIDPSTIIQLSAAAPPTTTDDPSLSPLWKLVSDAISSLQRTRNELSMVVNRNSLAGVAWNVELNNINQDMIKIQQFVKRHSKLVSASPKAVKRVEELNLLVMKANLLISQINSQNRAAQKSSSNRRSKRRRT